MSDSESYDTEIKSSPCVIIPDGREDRREEITLRSGFRTNADPTPAVEQLLESGFRPTGYQIFLRQKCPTCRVCIPARLPLALFRENGWHRRIRDKNTSLSVLGAHGMPMLHGYAGDQTVNLLKHYRQARFPESEVEAVSLLNRTEKTEGLAPHHIRAQTADGKLAGVFIYNTGKQAAHALLHFYDPALRKNGIGHFLMLSAIAHLRETKPQITHLYLGEWSRQPSAYSWKARYTPLELFLDGRWQSFSAADLGHLREPGMPAYPNMKPKAPAMD